MRAAFDEAMHCNGNDACYDWDPDQAMCPSWKGTWERRHSPKGRAMLLKEWLRHLAAAGADPVAETRRLRAAAGWRTLPARLRNTLARRRGEPDFSHEVKEAMDGCLACKSCVGGCPIKVNVPGFRAKFLEICQGRYLRPARDYLVASLEHLLPAVRRAIMARLFADLVRPIQCPHCRRKLRPPPDFRLPRYASRAAQAGTVKTHPLGPHRHRIRR